MSACVGMHGCARERVGMHVSVWLCCSILIPFSAVSVSPHLPRFPAPCVRPLPRPAHLLHAPSLPGLSHCSVYLCLSDGRPIRKDEQVCADRDTAAAGAEGGGGDLSRAQWLELSACECLCSVCVAQRRAPVLMSCHHWGFSSLQTWPGWAGSRWMGAASGLRISPSCPPPPPVSPGPPWGVCVIWNC